MTGRRLSLITGASAGIGAALARVYASHGWDVALTARRQDRLEALAAELRRDHGVETLVAPADLADPAAPERLVGAIAAAGRRVDALVNNAGYSKTAGFVSDPWRDHRDFLQVLLLAPMELARRTAPAMLDQGFGRILNVCSLAGLLPATAGDTLYGPTKGGLIKWSQGLHLEFAPRGVHVTALCPGYTWSEFHDVNGSRAAVGKAYPRWLWMRAEAVARAGFEAAEANRALCIPGGANKAMAALVKLLPESFTLKMTARHAARLGRI